MEQKKSKIVWIIIGIIVGIIIIGGIIAYYIISNLDRNTPEEVFSQYIDLLKNENYEEMFNLISSSTKERVDREFFLNRNKNIYEGIEACNIEVSNILYDKENKKIDYTMSFDTVCGAISFNNTVTFDRQEDNKYYINWYSSLIFPDLKEEYKVRVYTTTGKRGNILDRNGNILARTLEDGTREYPYGKAASHLVGYVGDITEEELQENKNEGYTSSSIIGKTGLEYAYEERLRGETGSEIYIVDENENIVKELASTNVKDGENIKTTIDIELQNKIYNEFDGDNGFSVAINPKTGEVLAMVSTPTYNANDFINGFSEEEWNKISNDSNTPFLCRYQSTWVPGSSFKPIIAAIGLTTGKMDKDEDYGRSGLSWQKDESWGDYQVTTLTTYSGPANLRNALIYSDNIYFAKSALKIGASVLEEQFKKIGFDKSLDFPIYMDASQFSNDGEFSSEIQLADTGYGQGEVLVNPLHIASIYSAFVNDGNMIKPYIEYNEKKEKEYLVKNAFSKDAANTIRDYLIQTVENPAGTAYEARISGITLAGKTGTAEIKTSQNDDTGTELGWFNCFIVSDDEDEQLLTINMIEDVKDRGGSHYLLPKVRNIFK